MTIHFFINLVLFFSSLGISTSIYAENLNRIFLYTNIGKRPELQLQKPGDNHDILNLTHPPIIYFDHHWSWKCLVCVEVPTIENGQIEIKKHRRKKLITTRWQIDPNYFWSDGTAVTGYDVLRTINLLRQSLPIVNRMIKNIEVDRKNPRKFSIAIRKSNRLHFQMLAIRLAPAGTNLNLSYGPFEIVSWTEKKVLLKHNPFHKKPRTPIHNITFIDHNALSPENLPKSKTLFTKSVLAQRPKLRKALEMSPHINLLHGDGIILESLILNLRNPNLRSSDLRRELSYHIDRDEIIRKVFDGLGVASDLFIHPADPSCPPMTPRKISTHTHKPHTEKDFEIVVNLPDTLLKNEIFEIIKDSWEQQGIKVKVKKHPPDFFIKKVIGQSYFSDSALASWKIVPGTLPYEVFFSDEIPTFQNHFRGLNLSGWVNREVDSVLKRSQSLHPQFEGKPLCSKLAQIFLQDQPIIPLLFRPYFLAHTKDIKGITSIDHIYSTTLFSDGWQILASSNALKSSSKDKRDL